MGTGDATRGYVVRSAVGLHTSLCLSRPPSSFVRPFKKAPSLLLFTFFLGTSEEAPTQESLNQRTPQQRMEKHQRFTVTSVCHSEFCSELVLGKQLLFRSSFPTFSF